MVRKWRSEGRSSGRARAGKARAGKARGREADLFKVLPFFRLSDGDGGFYLHKAAVVSIDEGRCPLPVSSLVRQEGPFPVFAFS
ncbi:hypothetical protein ACIGW8_25080 [Streptomyces sioyaensis]|uniref:hypothetical protein n=1 Tax=Streptomyces sioyaensis TaxID=67364 RepID=UPI0037D71716